MKSSAQPPVLMGQVPLPVTAPLPARRLSLAEALTSADETRALIVRSGALSEVANEFRHQFPGKRAVVIADPYTFKVAGQATQAALAAAGLADSQPFIFSESKIYAESGIVMRAEAMLRTNEFIPVAVGSGTINDVVKLAAHRTGRPYLCVATAASMDGYTAFGASITHEGAKQTFSCPAPRAVIADLDIICRAAPDMTASGYADLQAKITAGADWLLADALNVEPIDLRAWEMVQGGLAEALADPAGARAGRVSAIAALTEGLMLGGIAMQWTKSSRPASGAEHQFSHLWDMEHHTFNGEAPSHGFKVGVATIAVTALYEELLRLPLHSLDIDRCVARWPDAATVEADVQARFGTEEFLKTAFTETLAKQVTGAELRAQLECLRANWPALRERLRQQLVPKTELQRRLRLVGAPVEPEEIGIPRKRLRDSFVRAYHIRRRFTVLDLAVRANVLDQCLETLFGPGGIWEIGGVQSGNAASP